MPFRRLLYNPHKTCYPVEERGVAGMLGEQIAALRRKRGLSQKELAARLHGMLCHVNLIPVNEVKGNSYRKSSNEQIQRFIRILSEKGITATVRRTLGSDINASCGQLRRRYQEEVANVADLYEN